MLVIKTRVDESVWVEHEGETLEIRVTQRDGNAVKLGFTASLRFRIRRGGREAAT